jgi:hypothetical protein
MRNEIAALIFWGIPIAYILFRGFLSPDGRFLQRWAQAYGIELTEDNRPMVTTYLRRTKRIRTLGALAGVAFSVIYVTVTEDSTAFIGNGLFLAVVGYLIGTVVAEAVVPRPPRGATRMATLMPRRLQDYLPGYAIVALRALPLASVALIPVYALVEARFHVQVFHISPVAFAVISGGLAAMAAGIEAVERMIVRRPQPVLSPDLLEADDAIRSASVHALAGAGVALALLWMSYQLSQIGNVSNVSVLGWLLPVLAIAMLGLALSSWIDLGHPKAWQVRRHARQGSRA